MLPLCGRCAELAIDHVALFCASHKAAFKDKFALRATQSQLAPIIGELELSIMYASRAAKFHPDGGQFDSVWLPARAPHGGASYVWCLAA